MTIEKNPVLNLVNLEQAEEASAKFSQATARLNVIEALMNERINKIRNEYYEEIVRLNEEKELQYQVLETYAQQQKDNWGRRKSMELFHSVIGFRTSTPKVIKDKKFSWEGITELVKEKFPSFVRTKTELDKEAIIALRDDDVFLKLKKACYVDVVQNETFYVETKSEELQRA
jgi:phage host-nuclease inhibitor protein Gam